MRRHIQDIEAKFEKFDEQRQEWISVAYGGVLPGRPEPTPEQHWQSICDTFQVVGPDKIPVRMRRTIKGQQPVEFDGWIYSTHPAVSA